MSVATQQDKGFRLKGGHVLAMFVAGFSVIITVNLALAFNAVRTFPGIETKNSYVVSQAFEADRAAQTALGWDVSARLAQGQVLLSIRDAEGDPVSPRIVSATLGRATTTAQDVAPVFVFDGRDLVAPFVDQPGNWNLRLKAIAADGTPFRQRIIVEHDG
ncbi:MAG: FixH family protein [Pseudomonadota bacterium]